MIGAYCSISSGFEGIKKGLDAGKDFEFCKNEDDRDNLRYEMWENEFLPKDFEKPLLSH